MVGKRRRRIIMSSRKLIASCSENLIFFLCTFLLFSSLPKHGHARDTITLNSSISDNIGETLVSTKETFELGFFTPDESSTSEARYVGIWYYNILPKTVVWVANRDKPLPNRYGSFAITEDGNLHVLDAENISYWSTNLTSSSSNRMARLTEFGNLVLRNFIDYYSTSLWESFHKPTDTFLPGMLMGETLELTSWKSKDDPTTGNFKFRREIGKEVFNITWKRSMSYWRSVEPNLFIFNVSNQMPAELIRFLLSKPRPTRNCSTRERACRLTHRNVKFSYTRLVIRFTGEIEYLTLPLDGEKWDLLWKGPKDRCSVLNACGNFSSCNRNNGLMCKCLPGFNPTSLDTWNSGDFSGGCIRESSICGNKDTFLSLKMMQVRTPDSRSIGVRGGPRKFFQRGHYFE